MLESEYILGSHCYFVFQVDVGSHRGWKRDWTNSGKQGLDDAFAQAFAVTGTLEANVPVVTKEEFFRPDDS